MKVNTFFVLPNTPKKLEFLKEMASNLYFAWNYKVRNLFRDIDSDLWSECDENPVKFLSEIPLSVLENMAKDEQFLLKAKEVYDQYKGYIDDKKDWYSLKYGNKSQKGKIAYFSCEYGIHQCLPIYSGGLGILSGDHLKSASDLGIPIVAVGLLYKYGYFQQHLNTDGWQQESYKENNHYSMPIEKLLDYSGKPLILSVNFNDGEEVKCNIWKANVGKVELYLLDTNIPQNSEKNRAITNALYDSDRTIRIKQEIILGIGGYKALKLLNINPSVYHLNEGHSAFMLFEYLDDLISNKGLKREEALEMVRGTTLFTTHTPVPAGNERFDCSLIKKYLNPYMGKLDYSESDFLALGRVNPDNYQEEFCMTVLALKLCGHFNGVSKLHGKVSRAMWKYLFKDISEQDVPISSITNGIHTPTWLSPILHEKAIRYAILNKGVSKISEDISENIEFLPDEELWDIQEEKRANLVDFARVQLANQFRARGACNNDIFKASKVLDSKALTIGFARRFASYKRGGLIFNNPSRLSKILNNKDYPVQIVIAGKAHPADDNGKNIIKSIISIVSKDEFRDKIVFLENYDIEIAKHMLQGVDLWLNNPIKPMEASGTSGMKAAVNGALNFSVLDGWWDEAHDGTTGWAIGKGEVYENREIGNKIESELLYSTLERAIIPAFYNRDSNGVPTEWVSKMKNSIKKLGNEFSSQRMLKEYTDTYYIPCKHLHESFVENNYNGVREVSVWLSSLRRKWNEINIKSMISGDNSIVYKGKNLNVIAEIELGTIEEQDIVVECVYGKVDNFKEDISDGKIVELRFKEKKDNLSVFCGEIPCNVGGKFAYTVRVVPFHKYLAGEFIPGLIKWY